MGLCPPAPERFCCPPHPSCRGRPALGPGPRADRGRAERGGNRGRGLPGQRRTPLAFLAQGRAAASCPRSFPRPGAAGSRTWQRRRGAMERGGRGAGAGAAGAGGRGGAVRMPGARTCSLARPRCRLRRRRPAQSRPVPSRPGRPAGPIAGELAPRRAPGHVPPGEEGALRGARVGPARSGVSAAPAGRAGAARGCGRQERRDRARAGALQYEAAPETLCFTCLHNPGAAQGPSRAPAVSSFGNFFPITPRLRFLLFRKAIAACPFPFPCICYRIPSWSSLL